LGVSVVYEISVFIGIGAFAGLAAGLLGIGGGLIVVPALVWMFHQLGFEPATITHLALGTSLATIVFTAASSALSHHRRGAVRWHLFARYAPGVVAGALLGAALADTLSSDVLRRILGGFEFLIALRLILARHVAPHERPLPAGWALGATGAGVGTLAALAGIGGGILNMPYFLWCGLRPPQAAATSSATAFPVALAGALGYIVAGWNATALPAHSTGFIYWPAVAGIAVASVSFAPVGAHLAHRLPGEKLRRGFGVLLLAVAAAMLLR
jgi:uncharacterized membrane protein YfcA